MGMQQVQEKSSKWPKRVRIMLFVCALLILITGAVIWVLNSLNSNRICFPDSARVIVCQSFVLAHTSIDGGGEAYPEAREECQRSLHAAYRPGGFRRCAVRHRRRGQIHACRADLCLR